MSLVQNEHALKIKLVDSDTKYQNEHAIKVQIEGGGGGTITVDSEFSTTSENPVQNKVITNAIGDIESALNAINNEIGA